MTYNVLMGTLNPTNSLTVSTCFTVEPLTADQWCKQDQILKVKTKTTGSKQKHLADLTFK